MNHFGRQTQEVLDDFPSRPTSRTNTRDILICSFPTSVTNIKARPQPKASLSIISERRRDKFSRSPELFSAATARTFSISSFRISPDIRKDFKFRDIKRWMELYGVLEKITYVSNEDEGRASLKKAQEVRWHERPGISPALIPELLPRAIFLKLSDLNIALPPYREIAHAIDMERPRTKPTAHFRKNCSRN